MVFFSAANYQQASMTSSRLEQSKFMLGAEFLVEFDLDRFMKECDGFVYDTCSAYETEAIYATRRWLEESGSRKLYTIGPIFPWPDFVSSNHGLLAPDHEVPEYGTSVQAFMDSILASHGKNSLLYVSIWFRPFHSIADNEAAQLRYHSEVCGGPRVTTSDCTLISF